MTCYVYFVKPIGMDGPIKIGFSGEPERRLSTLATWSPFPLELMGKVIGNSSDETFLHRKFSDLHTHREWFNSSPLLRETISRILSGDPIRMACVAIPIKSGIKNQKKQKPTPERQRFIDYGIRIKRVTRGLQNDHGYWYAPDDIRDIMKAWRGDYQFTKSVIPTQEQIARIEDFLADPTSHGMFHSWKTKMNMSGVAA